MITKIKKRDGRKVPFNFEKISNAITKTMNETGDYQEDIVNSISEDVVAELEAKYNSRKVPSVEDIQDAVEKVLMEKGYLEASKAYILYRHERTRVREKNTRLMQTFSDITFMDAKDSDLKRENANIDSNTAMGTMLKYGSEAAKEFNRYFVMNPKHSKGHDSGDFHYHDFDFLMLTTTCTQIDLLDLFKGGFSTGHGHLREPNDIQSYSALACIAIQSNQNDQHGGQSVPNFDYSMAPGVAKTFARLYKKHLKESLVSAYDSENVLSDEGMDAFEEDIDSVHGALKAEGFVPSMSNIEDYCSVEGDYLTTMFVPSGMVRKAQRLAKRRALRDTDRTTFQAMEALIHNLNTMHSRAGAQVPFSSINYGTDTSPEGRLVIKNILLATEKGLGRGETPIFPIQIFKVKNGINGNPEDISYDLFKLGCRVSAKRMFPNFSFLDAPFNLQYYVPGRPETEIAYMGCRTRVIGNVFDPSNETVYGRGNLSFTTVNLPRLGIKHSIDDMKKFYKDLDKVTEMVVDQLLERFEIQARKKVKNYPFLMGQGVWVGSKELGPEDEVREVLKQGTLTVGFIGLAECLTALTGKHHGESPESQKLGLEIIEHMRKRMDEAAEKYKLNFSLIATPAEGLSGRFVKLDKKKYGVITGVTDKEFYTNSFHVPVDYHINAFNKISIEAPYHALTNAGHISYIELDGDPSDNLEAFEKVVMAMKDAGIGYGAINHPLDRDPVCGYTGVIGDTCPGCGRNEGDGGVGFERIRRITGYLVGTLDNFNDAKAAEERARVKHG